MVALLLVASALAATPADDFEVARQQAEAVVGTDRYASTVGMAERLCTPEVRGCAMALAELNKLDRAVRAEAAAKAKAEPAPAKAAEPEATVVSHDDPYSGGPPTILVDQPTGLEYVAGYRAFPAPWSGLGVRNFSVALESVQKVCVLKEGVPIPLGQEVPVAFSHEKGTPVMSCPAGRVGPGTTLFVPDDSVLYLMVFDASRQVYVVEKAYRCDKTRTDRIQDKTVTSCRPLLVR
jgi:hypothetical protein